MTDIALGTATLLFAATRLRRQLFASALASGSGIRWTPLACHLAAFALFFALSALAAMGGKILGTTIPARISGLGWRDALQLGVLMQCKGFVEVVVLTVLQDGGLISNAAFSALILAHVAAALFHALVRRDGVFEAMAPVSCGEETAPAE